MLAGWIGFEFSGYAHARVLELAWLYGWFVVEGVWRVWNEKAVLVVLVGFFWFFQFYRPKHRIWIGNLKDFLNFDQFWEVLTKLFFVVFERVKTTWNRWKCEYFEKNISITVISENFPFWWRYLFCRFDLVLGVI